MAKMFIIRTLRVGCTSGTGAASARIVLARAAKISGPCGAMAEAELWD